MVVSLKGMPVNTPLIVAMIVYNLLHLYGGFGQVFYREGNVFYQATGACGAHSANRWKNTGTHCPVFSIHFGVVGERKGLVKAERFQRICDGADVVSKLLLRHGLGLCKYGSEVVIIAGGNSFNPSRINILLVLQENRVVNRCQRQVIEHLCTLNHEVFGAHFEILCRCFQLL